VNLDKSPTFFYGRREYYKYLFSTFQSIGQAYEDIQTQNQQLLQQIIERDDHNTKVILWTHLLLFVHVDVSLS
jgi:E3 ubiquitin-protein ligase BRE1